MEFELWGPIEGDQLENRAIPRCQEKQGIYIWRRALPQSPHAVFNNRDFYSWLEEALIKPYARAEGLSLGSSDPSFQINIRPGFFYLNELSAGGGKISQGKGDYILNQVPTDQLPQLMSLLEYTTFNLGPVLYVGESDNLGDRISQHLRANSVLRNRLSAMGYSLQDVSVSFLFLKNCEENLRFVIEHILTLLLFSPLTKRPG